MPLTADESPETIRQQFPNLAKLAAKEDISNIVRNQVSGIGLRALAVAPRQIPYHAGNVYFELDNRSELWQGLKRTGGLAIFLLREFPNVKFELWAIRG